MSTWPEIAQTAARVKARARPVIDFCSPYSAHSIALYRLYPFAECCFTKSLGFKRFHWCCNASEALPFSFRASPLSASIVEETTLYGPWILDGMEINTVV